MIKLPEELGNKIAQALEQDVPPVVEQEKPIDPTPVEVPAQVSETPPEPETPVNPEVVTESKEEDWDEGLEPEVQVDPAPKETPVSFDYSKLGKSIGFEDVKSEEELVSKVKSLQTALEGVPDHLKKAIELSKQGGDYLSYLGVHTVDYSSIDPVELFKSDLLNRVQQAHPGLSKEALTEKYEEALGQFAPVHQLLEGQKLQKSAMDWQRQEAARVEREARERKTQADSRVKSSIDKLDEVRGFKLKPHHKSAMYEYITSGQLQKDLFSDQNYNYEALAEIAFERKYGKKANEFLWNKAKTATKKEVVKELTNPQIEKPSEKPQVSTDEPSIGQQWLDSLRARVQK